MNPARIVTSLLSIVVVASLGASPAAADELVACGAIVSGYLDGGADVLFAIGVRARAGGEVGQASFTMRDGYEVEDLPIHTFAAAPKSKFAATRTGTVAYSGRFREVLPGRGNGHEEQWGLWVGRSGKVLLRSISAPGPWRPLQDTQCLVGPEGQLVVLGHIDVPNLGTDHWSFILQGRKHHGDRL